MIAAYQALDVQVALARVTRLRVHTQKLEGDQVRYLIDHAYEVNLDEHELELLYDAVGSDAVFRETFDRLKPSCVTYNSYGR